MKYDMAGAATVLVAAHAIAELGLKIKSRPMVHSRRTCPRGVRIVRQMC